MNETQMLFFLLALGVAFGMVRYAPTRIPALPLQKVRASILGLLKRRPGASITEICRETGIAWGTAQHHLYLLRRARLATSAPTGRTHRFFLPDVDEKTQRTISALENPGARLLARRIIERPGSRQKDLCVELGFTRKVFRQHVNLLKAASLVEEVVRPRVRLYMPMDELKRLFPAASPASNGVALAETFAAPSAP